MSFEFSLSNPVRIRHFLSITACAGKLSDAVALEADRDALTVRCVSQSSTVHLAVTIPSHGFDRYRTVPLPAQPTDAAALGAEVLRELNDDEPAVAATGASANSSLSLSSLYPCINCPSKALSVSAARCSTMSLASLNFSYDATSSPTLAIRAQSTGGLLKHYTLHLDSRPSQRAHVDPSAFAFDSIAEARTWSNLLAAFPPATTQIAVKPGVARMTLRVVDSRIDSHALTGDLTAAPALGTVLSVESRSFLTYLHPAAKPQKSVSTAFGGLGAVSGIASVDPSQSVTPPPYSSSTVQLGSKTVECKPLRLFALFAEGLHRVVQVRIGGRGVPVALDALPRTASNHTGSRGTAFGSAAAPPPAPQPLNGGAVFASGHGFSTIVSTPAMMHHQQGGAGSGVGMAPVPATSDGPLPITTAALLLAATDDPTDGAVDPQPPAPQRVAGGRSIRDPPSAATAGADSASAVPPATSQRSLRATVNTPSTHMPVAPAAVGHRRERPDDAGLPQQGPSAPPLRDAGATPSPAGGSAPSPLGSTSSFVDPTNPALASQRVPYRSPEHHQRRHQNDEVHDDPLSEGRFLSAVAQTYAADLQQGPAAGAATDAPAANRSCGLHSGPLALDLAWLMHHNNNGSGRGGSSTSASFRTAPGPLRSSGEPSAGAETNGGESIGEELNFAALMLMVDEEGADDPAAQLHDSDED